MLFKEPFSKKHSNQYCEYDFPIRMHVLTEAYKFQTRIVKREQLPVRTAGHLILEPGNGSGQAVRNYVRLNSLQHSAFIPADNI